LYDSHAAQHLKGQVIPRVIVPSVPERGEALTGRSAHDHVGHQAIPLDRPYVLLEYLGPREVASVSLHALVIYLDREQRATPHPVQSESESTSTREEIDEPEHHESP
jgi:hypothetical protein